MGYNNLSKSVDNWDHDQLNKTTSNSRKNLSKRNLYISNRQQNSNTKNATTDSYKQKIRFRQLQHPKYYR